MEILSHRGLWTHLGERNLAVAFNHSFDLGMGTETDLRDYNGEIVIAHDPFSENAISFRDLLAIMNGRNLTLALNIKSDGLANEIIEILNEFEHTNYFTFDMSVPELVKQLKTELNVFTGISDIAPNPVLMDACEGVWLDCFKSDWYESSYVDGLLSKNKKVCLVSADLHGRNTQAQWELIAKINQLGSDKLMLCTDKPLEAKDFFGKKL